MLVYLGAFWIAPTYRRDSQVAPVAKNTACQCRRCKRRGFNPRVGKIPWRRAWQPTPVFLPGKVHGQRSLAGYSSQGHKEHVFYFSRGMKSL